MHGLFLPLFLCIGILGIKTDGGSIFADLTEEEMKQVASYLMKQSSLRLVQVDVATVNSSYIYTIEALQPPKTAALLHLDQGGQRPGKKARVIIMRGDATPPVVEEYVVYPLPNPSQHNLLKYEYTKDPIPYHARLDTNIDETAFVKVLHAEVAKVDHILVTITGYSYTNCSDDGNCLTWSSSGPPYYDRENRTLFLSLFRDIEGWTVQPVGLDCLISMPGSDVTQWTITWVSFRDMTFPSFDQMKEYYKNKTPKPDENWPVDNKTLPTSQHFRGTPRPSGNQRGPRTSYPDGARFKVKENHIEWLGWSLDFGIPTTTGPRLHDIRFLGDRVAYEISLQEISVYYSGYRAAYTHTKYFDSSFNQGTTYSAMFPGVDCPKDAHFTDSVHYYQGKVKVYKNTACIFELDRGVPLRRHYSTNYEGGYYFYSGMPGNVLVLRVILSVENYDYIQDFIFHQGGQMEVKVSFSGYIIGSYYYTKSQDKYGFRVSDETTLGVLHSHFTNYKVDLDINGVKNRFRTLQIDLEQYPDPLDNSRLHTNTFINESVKTSEKEAAYQFNFDTPTYLVLYNEESKNRYGNTRGYRILNHGMGKQLLPADTPGGKSRTWADYQVAVTKRKDSEPRSSSLYNYMEQDDPVINFGDFIEDDENILDEDLVAWVTVGAHHIPIAEDIPIVQTPGSDPSFYLIPFNYFDEDPSLASRDNVRVEPGEADGQHTYRFSGVPADKVCDTEGITCEGNSFVSSGKIQVEGVLPIILFFSVLSCSFTAVFVI